MKRLTRLLHALSRLMRWEDYTSFLQVILGFGLVRQFQYQLSDWVYIGQIFIVFSPLLYGGLYTLNDVMDAKHDAQSSLKKGRPIPNGDISRKRALIVSITLIALSLFITMLWGDYKAQIIILTYLFINMFYTFVAKHIPVLELIVNTITHPLRMIFGAWLAGGYVPNELIALWSIGIFTGSVFRRIKEYVEGNQHARPVMKYYSIKSLIFLYFSGIFLCIILGIIFSGIVQYFAFAWGLILSVIYIGYFRSNNIRKIIEFAWR